MRFTRLRLNGFKSFVDPTDLIIHDGLTGVVGPNGCGKSNLLEALRWVMGENRPTAMRGEGMEDVIFAGAATRPARPFAEVCLSIDNSDRLAPAGFNESDSLEIVRRITRDAGSAYKVNTRDVRARDVQMLFADASTGAHSPALVRQGQIAELINARPKARRRILEEAAGISGLYQRRHEAELKLNGAEQNLLRVDDVLENLNGQLATLARQARQAARYREIGTDLRRAEGMLLYLRWHEADLARAEAEAQLRDHLALAARTETAAREAAEARAALDDRLPPLREEEAIAGAILQRLMLQRETLDDQERQAAEAIGALKARIAQLDHDAEREAGLNRDAGETIARLEWEMAQLAKAAEGHDEKLALAAEAAAEASALLQEREAQLAEMTEEVARLAARHGAVARQLSDSRMALERSEAEAEAAQEAAEEAAETLATAGEAFEAAQAAQEEAQETAETAEEALAAAEETRADILARESAARAARSEAEGEAGALRSEVMALARLISREAGGDDALLNHVSAAPGYEAALGAALADDLNAPEAGEGATGWGLLPGYPAPQPLPEGAAPLAPHVTVPPVLARRIGQIGVVPDAATGLRLQPALAPGQRLVTAAGDLWRWDGFRTAAGDAPSAAALRLTQINRLAGLQADLETAETAAAAARNGHEALTRALADATGAETRAREARRAADQRLTDTGRALSKAEAEQALSSGRLESARLAVARHAEAARAARAALEEAEAQAADLPDIEGARSEVDAVKMTVEAARLTMLTRRASHDDVRREGEARTRRRQEVVKELSGWRQRLETAERRGAELAARREEALAELEDAAALPEEIAERRGDLAEQIDTAQTRRDAATAALRDAENALRAAQTAERDSERAAGDAREARARTEARVEASREALAQAAERIAEVLETTPEALHASLDLDGDLPPAEVLESDVARLKRQREALGAVNLRAEEDAQAVQTEFDTLSQEKADLEEAIRKLRAGIAGLNREGRERLLAAYEQVNGNFSTLYTHLFGGGEARLVLVESDDPLEAGLEIMCQPPGKKLSTLSLLSGGEQTLTALALIFAVFLANPAPICVLDEVDAPLDDANVTRFCDMMDEMTRRTDTRFLVITHHAVTMSRMDRLFGVTMQEQGVSQLVSVDLKRAEQMVA
ncbi:chromosome segregation protein SMC [Sinirhodobacter populi]|uniref:Chromosome partition protein Smc n=1 Tax=Paenirhodobacter populi TaxID=2306993 RepID=A0A443KKX7_9RHOB|nr:AAA family ATPase [Sinirhodobacter populi]RWR33384.1 chromosome segregation protein SMC [Sinirhodobacter populi]